MSEVNINKKGWKYQWSEYEDNILREYYPKGGYEEVLKFLPNRNKGGIQGRASKIGIKYLHYNYDYFEKINTPEKAYWLGFIYTDGYITTKNRFGMELSISDINHMQKFLDAIEYNGKIRTRKRKIGESKNTTTSCQFQIKNSKLYNDLLNCGLTRTKTNDMTFPDEDILPLDLRPHFIRGVFDGDGSFVFYNYKRLRKDRNNKIYTCTYKEINFVCKSDIFINEIKKIIKDESNADFNLTCSFRDNLPTLRTSKADNLIKFINYIYPNKDSDVFLERKYKISQDILKYCLI